MNLSLIRSDVSRWLSGATVLTIGKYLLLLMTPLSLLYTYGKVQSVARHDAEARVEQLTNDVRTMSTALAQAEAYSVTRRQQINSAAVERTVLTNDDGETLDLPIPDSIVDILRPVLRAE